MEAAKKVNDIGEQEDDFEETIFTLNIGGTHRFMASQSLLTKISYSLLGRAFSNPSKLKFQSDGSIFIDRNGKYFELILDYLRNDCSLPDLHDEQAQLMFEKELDYWKLTAIYHPDFAKLEEITLQDPETDSDDAFQRWVLEGPFPLEEMVNQGKINLNLGQKTMRVVEEFTVYVGQIDEYGNKCGFGR